LKPLPAPNVPGKTEFERIGGKTGKTAKNRGPRVSPVPPYHALGAPGRGMLKRFISAITFRCAECGLGRLILNDDIFVLPESNVGRESTSI
jgi:hypothetical protein